MPEPFTATLTTLVGLIATYKQLTDGRKSNAAQDFLAWLTAHRFTQISDQIARSYDLQANLGELLQQDHRQLGEKLEIIEDVLRSVASKLDGFSGLKEFADHSEYLTDQACEFMRQFNACGSGQAVCEIDEYECMIAFLPVGSGAFVPSEPRFFFDDLDKLDQAGWIKISSYTNGGTPIYSLTRKGAAAAVRLT